MKNYIILSSFLLLILSSCGSGSTENKNEAGATVAPPTPTVAAPAANFRGLRNNIVFGGRKMGACIGKGLCNVKAAEDMSEAMAIPVDIEVDSVDSNTLILSFRLKDLFLKHRQQYSIFKLGNPTYAFDTICPLTDPVLQPLQLKPNARILQGAPNFIQRKREADDTLIIYRVVYTHD